MRLYDLIKNDKVNITETGDLFSSDGLFLVMCNDNDDVVGKVELFCPYFGNMVDSVYDELHKKSKILNKDNNIYLYDLYINPKFRNMGYATNLIDKCKEITLENDCNYLTLITRSDNEPAKKLYKKYGFNVEYSDDIKEFYYLPVT